MTTPGRHERHRHAKKLNPARITIVTFFLIVGCLVLAAVLYSIANPSPHGSQSHATPPVSAAAPTHAKPAPTRTAPPAHRTAPSKPKPPASRSPKPAVVRYTVKLGDNLSSIADMFHLPSYVPLYDANHAAIGNNPNLIHVGLRLKVPERQNDV